MGRFDAHNLNIANIFVKAAKATPDPHFAELPQHHLPTLGAAASAMAATCAFAYPLLIRTSTSRNVMHVANVQYTHAHFLRMRHGHGIRKLAHEAATMWRKAGPAERVGMTALAIGAATATSTLVSLVAHVSSIFAFMLLPALLFPLVLVVAASIGTILLSFLVLGGFGYVVFLPPLFAVGALMKVVGHFFAIAMAASFVSKKLLRKRGVAMRDVKRNIVSEFFSSEDEYAREFSGEEQLRSFDEKLYRRTADAPRQSKDVAMWSVLDVVDELTSAGLGQYRNQFIEERIDGAVLLGLTEQDIRTELGPMPLGDRIKLSRWVATLQQRPSRNK